jgi:hypothetical protein
MSSLLLPRGGTWYSRTIANYATGNKYADGAEGSVHYSTGAVAATLIVGVAAQDWSGMLQGVIAVKSSTNTAAVVTFTDSNDAGSLANKRTFQMSIYGGTSAANQAAATFIPFCFQFHQGLVLTVVDAAGTNALAVFVDEVNRRAGNFH